MKSFLSNLLLSSVILLLSVLLLEGLCRILYSWKLDYQIEMSRYAATLKRESAHPGVGHEHRPGRREHLMGVDVAINSHGFRDAEYPIEKPLDEYRVMLLGDSLTLGWGVAAADTFARRLEHSFVERLAACGSSLRPRVLNAGVGNYNTDQEVSFFEARGSSFDPDLVILAYFINDAEPTPHKRLPTIVQYSYLGMSVWGRIDLFKRLYITKEDFSNYYPGLYEDSMPGWQRTRDALGRLAALSRARGFGLVLTLLPELHAVGATYGFQRIHDQVRGAAGQVGIAHVIDLAEDFAGEQPESLWVSMDDAHPNAKAHAIIANGLTRELAQRGIPGCVGRVD